MNTLEIITGDKEISGERHEQLGKHKRSLGHDFLYNRNGELAFAAAALITMNFGLYPPHWSRSFWDYASQKPVKERVKIAGALCAAELDRLQWIKISEKKPQPGQMVVTLDLRNDDVNQFFWNEHMELNQVEIDNLVWKPAPKNE